MSRIERIDSGPAVEVTYDRMCEIVGLITPTRSESASTEYSALMCTAVIAMAASRGIAPTQENLSIMLHLMVEVVIPAVEEAIDGHHFN
jgi:hypothetical protein